MPIAGRMLTRVVALWLLLSATVTMADEIFVAVAVAVASNFAGTLKTITKRFEAATGHKVHISVGATGKQYAQIRHGAPFDLFFAADSRRPELLESEGFTQPGSRFTYALGKLVLWSPLPAYVDPQGKILEQGDFKHLAMANPRLAPYGKAAREVLQALGLWQRLQPRTVRGENIGQAFQFVKSGNAELGLVAWSQIKRAGPPAPGSHWAVPTLLYSPIEQQAVVLKPSKATREFAAFVRSNEVKALIRDSGYDLP